MSGLDMSFGSNLKALRTSRKLTQGELSKLANVELAQISRIERDSTQPKLDTIRKLAVALECSTDNLIFDEHEIVLPGQVANALKKIEKLNRIDRAKIIDIIECYCAYKLLNEHFRESALAQNPGLSDFINEQYSEYEIESRQIEIEKQKKILAEEEASLNRKSSK